MASYQFFKMTALRSQIYFRHQFQRWHSFKYVENHWHTKCRWDISFHGWVIGVDRHNRKL